MQNAEDSHLEQQDQLMLATAYVPDTEGARFVKIKTDLCCSWVISQFQHLKGRLQSLKGQFLILPIHVEPLV